jgi:MOSC domain-containing protein
MRYGPIADVVGVVEALWRFPVKSMLGESVETAELTPAGVVGDRAYALVDSESGKVVSAKNPRLWPRMFQCRAAFVEAPLAGKDMPAVRITLPDGTSVTSDSPDAESTLAGFFGRAVMLERAAPEDFTIDHYHPDVEDLDPEGHRDTTTEQKLGSAFFAEAGLPAAVPVGAFFDLFPLSVLTTSTLAELARLSPESRFDARRFRMNVIVATQGKGFVENGWIDRRLHIGQEVVIEVALPDPRCVMTTLAQDDLPKDNEILRTLARHNRLDVAGGGRYPCAGVYAVVATGGTIKTGDTVSLA